MHTHTHTQILLTCEAHVFYPQCLNTSASVIPITGSQTSDSYDQ